MKQSILHSVSRLLLPVLLALFATGCEGSDDYSVPDSRTEKDGTVLLLNMKVGREVGSGSAMEADNESLVSRVDVLVFEDDIYSYTGHGVIEKATGKVAVPLLQSTRRCRLVLVANNPATVSETPGVITRDDALSGKTLIQTQQLIVFDCTVKWDPSLPIPMWGQSTTVGPINDKTTFSTFMLYRALARVDVGVGYTTITNGSESATGIADFSLEEVRVYRSHTHGLIIPLPGNIDLSAEKVTGASVVPGNDVLRPDNEYLDYPLSTDQQSAHLLARAVYLPESEAGSLLTATCLVIGGKYKGGAEKCYYRVNFAAYKGEDSVLWPILRNHRYNVNIASVTREGADTPEEALRSAFALYAVAVEDWAGEDSYEGNVSGAYAGISVISSEVWVDKTHQENVYVCILNIAEVTDDDWEERLNDGKTSWVTPNSGTVKKDDWIVTGKEQSPVGLTPKEGTITKDDWEERLNDGKISWVTPNSGTVKKDDWIVTGKEQSPVGLTPKEGTITKDDWEERLNNGKTSWVTPNSGTVKKDDWEERLNDGKTSWVTSNSGTVKKDDWEQIGGITEDDEQDALLRVSVSSRQVSIAFPKASSANIGVKSIALGGVTVSNSEWEITNPAPSWLQIEKTSTGLTFLSLTEGPHSAVAITVKIRFFSFTVSVSQEDGVNLNLGSPIYNSWNDGFRGDEYIMID